MIQPPFRLLLFVLLLSLLAPSSLQAQYAEAAPEENAWYGIVARGSGRSMDVSKASQEAGAAVVQWEFTHPASQQWRFVRVLPYRSPP